VAVLSLLSNIVLYKRYSTSHPIVRIGPDVITKKQYLDSLEYQSGTEVIKKMVYTILIRQAAAKAHIMPTNADIDARVAEIQRTNPQMLALANSNPVQMVLVRDDLKTDIALENLRIAAVSITPKDVQNYYDAHKQDFTLPQQVQTTMVVTTTQVDAGTAELLLQNNTPEDVIARQPRMHVAGVNGFAVNVNALGVADRNKLSKTIFAMKDGDIKTIPVQGAFLTFKVKHAAAKGVPPLSQIITQVTRAAKLEKAMPPEEMIASLYQAAKPQFDSTDYANYFNDVANYKASSAQ
jgi:hypothetical protein